MKHEWSTRELTADLLGRLLADRWLAVVEVQIGHMGQRADVLAMRRKFDGSPMLIFEIKTSRADLLQDLRREKWRGYLSAGAVAFAFPQDLADPKEIPAEAGVYLRVGQGWSWKRSPKWARAPKPSDYLFRRLAMTVSDQVENRAKAHFRPRAADLYHVAARARTEIGRRLATIANDIDGWERMLADLKARMEGTPSAQAPDTGRHVQSRADQ